MIKFKKKFSADPLKAIITAIFVRCTILGLIPQIKLMLKEYRQEIDYFCLSHEP